MKFINALLFLILQTSVVKMSLEFIHAPNSNSDSEFIMEAKSMEYFFGDTVSKDLNEIQNTLRE